MEFSAYADTHSSKKGKGMSIKLPKLFQNVKSKKILIIGALVLFLGIGFATSKFLYNTLINPSQKAGNCSTKEDGIVDAYCHGDKMVQRKRILLCCPAGSNNCKFWKYEPAGEKEDPRCKSWSNNQTNNNSTQHPDSDLQTQCAQACKHYGFSSGYYDNKNNKCHCDSPNSQKIVGLECTTNSDCSKNGSKICVDGYCIGQDKTENTTLNASCSGKKNGDSCSDSNGINGICYNNTCYNKKYLMYLSVQDYTESEAKTECAKLGGTDVIKAGSNYICIGCHKNPITQKPLFCTNGYCPGAKSCVAPGTTSPGTDCKWYICDPKGSGLWIQTNKSCTNPAPGTTTPKPTATATPTPTATTVDTPTPTQTPTPTPTQTSTPTPTPTPIPGDLSINHQTTGACTDFGYTANYTITITYADDPNQDLADINYTVKTNLDSNIDPSWVNTINNAGNVDSSTKTITWPDFTLAEGQMVEYTYKIDYPTNALNNSYVNTAIVSYNNKSKQASATTTTSCAESNNTSPTPTQSSGNNTNTVPNTGIIDNITLTGSILATIIIGLLIGL